MTPIKDPAESVVVEFDFSSELTAIDSALVAISVTSGGVDQNAQSIIVGTHQISGTSVRQRIGSGLDGINYNIRCAATHGDDVIVRASVIPVRTA